MDTHSNILFIDDDDDLLDAAGQALEGAGYRVLRARGGEAGLAMLRSAPKPVIVLLDLVMPGTTGWDILDAIRDDLSLRTVPVIVFTGLDELPRETRCPVMRKPVDFDVLVELITALDEQERGFAFAVEEPPSNLLPRLR